MSFCASVSCSLIYIQFLPATTTNQSDPFIHSLNHHIMSTFTISSFYNKLASSEERVQDLLRFPTSILGSSSTALSDPIDAPISSSLHDKLEALGEKYRRRSRELSESKGPHAEARAEKGRLLEQRRSGVPAVPRNEPITASDSEHRIDSLVQARAHLSCVSPDKYSGRLAKFNGAQTLHELERAADQRKIIHLQGSLNVQRLQIDFMKAESVVREAKIEELNRVIEQLRVLNTAMFDIRIFGSVLHDSVHETNEGGEAEEALVHAIMGEYRKEHSIWNRVISSVVGPRCPDVDAHRGAKVERQADEAPTAKARVSTVAPKTVSRIAVRSVGRRVGVRPPSPPRPAVPCLPRRTTDTHPRHARTPSLPTSTSRTATSATRARVAPASIQSRSAAAPSVARPVLKSADLHKQGVPTVGSESARTSSKRYGVVVSERLELVSVADVVEEVAGSQAPVAGTEARVEEVVEDGEERAEEVREDKVDGSEASFESDSDCSHLRRIRRMVREEVEQDGHALEDMETDKSEEPSRGEGDSETTLDSVSCYSSKEQDAWSSADIDRVVLRGSKATSSIDISPRQSLPTPTSTPSPSCSAVVALDTHTSLHQLAAAVESFPSSEESETLTVSSGSFYSTSPPPSIDIPTSEAPVKPSKSKLGFLGGIRCRIAQRVGTTPTVAPAVSRPKLRISAPRPLHTERRMEERRQALLFPRTAPKPPVQSSIPIRAAPPIRAPLNTPKKPTLRPPQVVRPTAACAQSVTTQAEKASFGKSVRQRPVDAMDEPSTKPRSNAVNGSQAPTARNRLGNRHGK
ncbi:hypothetical protein D9613_006977 [Agrocybe pediades]|uniref:Uncharacterized protein n=1 Tax=Agrocybe pediades TaxID=84607 RepID=A0A8H4QGM0_9AGAR|nr:hypothetical protein D9613_006977 [Agrocybe pediades]